jgi:ubiquinone/menaquinone biosynthesis C-methylase UbiE
MRVCPWWLGPLLASPLRRLWENPRRILAPHVRPGMTVLEPGPGMGFFTLELARLVGPAGRVVAVDVQPRMIDGLRQRAKRAGLASTIETRLARGEELGVADLAGRVDLVVALSVVHELPDPARFFEQVRRALKPAGRILVTEPRGHVGEAAFAETLRAAEAAGLARVEPPAVAGGRTALLRAP